MVAAGVIQMHKTITMPELGVFIDDRLDLSKVLPSLAQLQNIDLTLLCLLDRSAMTRRWR